jgi:hypothetical protein
MQEEEPKLLASIPSPVKLTAVGTIGAGALLLQVMAFYAVGDAMTSIALFGLGYAVGRWLK